MPLWLLARAGRGLLAFMMRNRDHRVYAFVLVFPSQAEFARANFSQNVISG
jgi:hypothetical protein